MAKFVEAPCEAYALLSGRKYCAKAVATEPVLTPLPGFYGDDFRVLEVSRAEQFFNGAVR